MAIGTDAAIEFFGTQDAVTTTGASTADGVVTSAGSWTNDDDAPMASAVLNVNYSVAPTAGTAVNLYARIMNVQSTNDPEAPATTYLNTFIGAFPVNAVTTSQFYAIEVALPNTATSQVYDFYIENQTGQTIPVNWGLWITPKTIGPHA